MCRVVSGAPGCGAEKDSTTDARLKREREREHVLIGLCVVCLEAFKSSVACGSRVAFVAANEIKDPPS